MFLRFKIEVIMHVYVLDASKTFLEQLQMTKETFAHSSRENKVIKVII